MRQGPSRPQTHNWTDFPPIRSEKPIDFCFTISIPIQYTYLGAEVIPEAEAYSQKARVMPEVWMNKWVS